MNFEDKLEAFNSKSLLQEHQRIPIDEFLQVKRQLDQVRIQRERDEIMFKQKLDKKDRDFEYRSKEVQDREHKLYEIESKLLKEDFTYKLHQLEQERSSTVKSLQDTIANLEEVVTHTKSQYLDALHQQEVEGGIKFDARCHQHKLERQVDVDNFDRERQQLLQKCQEEVEQRLTRGQQDKDKSLSVMEQQNNLEIALIRAQWEVKLKKISEGHQEIVTDLKNDLEVRRQLYKDQIDAEKANTNLFRRRAQEFKKTFDHDMDTVNQEQGIIMQQHRAELVEERGKRETLQNQYDLMKFDVVCKETKLIDDYTSRENGLRLRLQNQINDMYQKQIEVAQTLDKQYRDLDLAAERKYDKLKQNYQSLQKIFSESLDRSSAGDANKKNLLMKRHSVRRSFKENNEDGVVAAADSCFDVLNVLSNVGVPPKSSTITTKKR